MPKYALDSLGSMEFERMAQSLVQQVIGPAARIFGMGKDGAREATFEGSAPYPSSCEQWSGKWIFQAKFHDVSQLGPVAARKQLVDDVNTELLTITKKYAYACDNYILITNVTLTPVFQTGTRDYLDNEVLPKFRTSIPNIHIWGGDEVCRFLDAYPGIRCTYAHLLTPGDIVAALLGQIESSRHELERTVKLYCQGCFDHERYAALDDAGDVDDHRVSLSKVFVDLDVDIPSSDNEPTPQGVVPEWLRQAASVPGRRSVMSYLFDDSVPGLVLVGGPGLGKSTLGQYMAQAFRARLLGRLADLEEREFVEKCTARIPFRIILREYAQWVGGHPMDDSLTRYLAESVTKEAGREVTSASLQDIISGNPSILILDGLDEVAQHGVRNRLLDNVTAFINQAREILKADVRVVATTRPQGYSQEFAPTSFLHLRLRTMDKKKAESYAKRWTESREPSLTERSRVLFTFQSCIQDKVVSVLIGTPLQITILLVIIRAKGSPPKQREQLFDSYMDIIYQRDQKHRPELLRTEQSLMYGLHKYLAYLLHRRAEKDEASAVMNNEEFGSSILQYLTYTDPTLNSEEAKLKCDQLLHEANERLVLIESPRQGYFGFGLTSVREFFAAAHLVDTAKNSLARDRRLKAIAKRPHWRNVALFFAGRVGRRLSGEAASLIDVCREIDTEGSDKFIFRGAELVVQILEDRALREPHNELGATLYALSKLDERFVPNADTFFSGLKNLTERFRLRVIQDWIRERIQSAPDETVGPYISASITLLGLDQPAKDRLLNMTCRSTTEYRKWAVIQSLRLQIAGDWLGRSLLEVSKNERLSYWIHPYSVEESELTHYFELEDVLGEDSMRVLVEFLSELNGNTDWEVHEKRLASKLREATPNRTLLLAWAFALLKVIRSLKVRHRDGQVRLFWPLISAPILSGLLADRIDLMERFQKLFDEANDCSICYIRELMAAFIMLPDLEPLADLSDRWDQMERTECRTGISRFCHTTLNLIFPVAHRGQADLGELKRLIAAYDNQSQEDWKSDEDELNSLMNRVPSDRREGHSQILFQWSMDFPGRSFEPYVAEEAIRLIIDWLALRRLSLRALQCCGWSVNLISDIEVASASLARLEECVNHRLSLAQMRLPIVFLCSCVLSADSNRIKNLTERARLFIGQMELIEFETMPEDADSADWLYCMCLALNELSEGTLERLSNYLLGSHEHSPQIWRIDGNEQTLGALRELIFHPRLPISRWAALSLASILDYNSNSKLFSSRTEQTPEADRIFERLWALAEGETDIRSAILIGGMAGCSVPWFRYHESAFGRISSTTDAVQLVAWSNLLKRAKYSSENDRDALRTLLMSLLSATPAISRIVLESALVRLKQLEIEIEGNRLDEDALDLPLPQVTAWPIRL